MRDLLRRIFLLQQPLQLVQGAGFVFILHRTLCGLIANHSFELPVVTKSRGWDIMTPVDWIVEKLSNGDPVGMELQRGVNGWSSSDGEQHTELATNQAVVISQTVDTIPGEEYTLTWDYSPRPNTDKPESKMKVRVNGDKVATNNKNGKEDVNWKTKTYSFIADAWETTVSFEDAGGQKPGQGAFLDNVHLGRFGNFLM